MTKAAVNSFKETLDVKESSKVSWHRRLFRATSLRSHTSGQRWWLPPTLRNRGRRLSYLPVVVGLLKARMCWWRVQILKIGMLRARPSSLTNKRRSIGEIMRRRTRVAVALVAAGALALTAGGTALAKTAPTPLQVAQGYMKFPAKITQKIPLKVKPPRGIKVTFMQAGVPQQIQQFDVLTEAVKSLGWTANQIPFAGSDGASITSAFTTALAQGTDVIIAPGITTALVSDSLRQRLLAAKVPVIVAQACPSEPLKPPLFPGALMCGAGEAPGAKALANWLAADSGGKGHVLLEYMPQFPLYAAFHDLLISELKKACPGCTVDTQEVTLAQYSSNQLSSILVNRLRKDPSITYLFYDNGSWTRGILPALDAAGLLGKIKIGGRSIDPTSQAALKANQMVAWTALPQGTMLLGSLDSALRVLTKSSGITLNAVVPTQLITNVNVNTIPDPYLYAPANSLAQYKKLWKVS